MSIQAKNLKKQFGGNTAIDDLSLEIASEEITGIIGPNGAGKSTLVNLLTGLEIFDDGSIAIADTELEKIEAHEVAAHGITRTFQQVRLFVQMSVLDNLLVVLTDRGGFGSLFQTHDKKREAQAREILEIVGLKDKASVHASQLSYGQRKLLEIARALAMDTETILFDEPFAGLFPEMRETVSGVIRDLKADGKTVVLIEHDMEIIKALCDVVIVLDAGGLLAKGNPQEVLEMEAVKEAYLGA